MYLVVTTHQSKGFLTDEACYFSEASLDCVDFKNQDDPHDNFMNFKHAKKTEMTTTM